MNLGGGPTFNAGDLGEHFGDGWGPAFGVTFDSPNDRLGFQFEYAYRWFDVKDDAPFFGATTFSANHKTHQLDFNLVANLAPAGRRGSPLYHRRPRRLLPQRGDHGVRRHRRHLRPVLVRVRHLPDRGDVIGSRGGWDFGFNVGGGVGISHR